MKRISYLVTLAILILLGCQQSAKNGEIEEQDISAVLDILNSIDTARKPDQDALEFKEQRILEEIMSGKTFCECHPHNTGQAHFHPNSTIRFARDGKTPFIGLLKRYEKNIDTGHHETVKPCYLLYVNTNNIPLKECQHFSKKADKPDEPAKELLKIICISNIQVAYDLRSEDTTDHNSPPDKECHDEIPVHP